MKPAVYRHYDAEGRLLYIGASSNHLRRLAEHAEASAWAGEIARVTVQHLDTIEEAFAAEREAIRQESPVYNLDTYSPAKPYCRRPAKKPPMLEPAATIIRKMGGRHAIASIVGVHRTVPSKWLRPAGRGGTGGTIPMAHIPAIMAAAREKGIALSMDDFLPTPEAAA